ncbi:MAG: hypothetical protein IJK62_13370 [Bacteroidales bacterium]|nr:hypothetical protein [Bacteroidales bacterium]
MKKRIILLSAITAIMALVIFAGCDKFMKIVTVKTYLYSDATSTSVTLKGEVISTGGNDEVSERGFFYSTNKNLKPALTVECGPGQKGPFEAIVKGLQPNTKYYYQAYVKSEDDMDVGDVLDFTTFELDFILTTEQPEILGDGRVTLKGSYNNKANININKIGFEYAKNANFRNADTVYASNVQTPFSVSLELDDATYYCRAFVMAEESTLFLYGDLVEFESVEHIPTVTTNDASEITSTSAVLNATIAGEINNKGFYLSTNPGFTGAEKIDVGSGVGNGRVEYGKTDLTPNTTYYYKAYVTYHNGANELQGERKEFTTNPSK